MIDTTRRTTKTSTKTTTTTTTTTGNKHEATVLIETTQKTTKTTITTTTKARKVESVNRTDVLPGTVASLLATDVVATEKKRCSLIQDASERIQN